MSSGTIHVQEPVTEAYPSGRWRAVVLGGGGATGIAWEVGLLLGLSEGGVELRDADRIVGTSAGSYVGAHVASGTALEDLFAAEVEPTDEVTERLTARLGPPYLRRLAPLVRRRAFAWVGDAWLVNRSLQTLFRYARERRAARRGAGLTDVSPTLPLDGSIPSPRAFALSRIAAGLGTSPESASRRWFQHTVPDAGTWPAVDLVITGIDLASGRFVSWDRTSGIPLPSAVAASCALPGFLPPITIDGKRFIDGGMYSTTNAFLAEGFASVVVVAPIYGETTRREVEALRADGTTVELILPDTVALEAIGRGTQRLDVERRRRAALAGREQGRVLAASLASALAFAA